MAEPDGMFFFSKQLKNSFRTVVTYAWSRSHLELIVSCLLIGQFEFDFICITIGTNKRQLKTHSNQMTQGADRVVPEVPRVPKGTNT